MIDKVTQERSMVKFSRILVESHIVANCNKEKRVVWKKKPATGKETKETMNIDHPLVDNPGNNSEQENREEVAKVVAVQVLQARPIEKWRGGRLLMLLVVVGLLLKELLGDKWKQSLISSRILLIWKDKLVGVDIISENAQMVHCKVKFTGQKHGFMVTVVYRSNSMEDRKSLWESLASIGTMKDSWIIFGDFNAMFSFHDICGGRPIRNNDIVDAQSWLALGQVEEFKSSSSFYTWTKKHEVGDRIYSKLDRVFINSIWLNNFPNSDACFKWEVIVDHCLRLIRNEVKCNIGVKPFRFGNDCLSYNGFASTVMEQWNKKVAGCGLDSLMQRLFRVKHALKNFNRKEVGDVITDYRKAKEDYCKIQEAAALNPNDRQQQLEVSVKQQRFQAAKDKFQQNLRQQSKVNWIKFSDENTIYFHAVMRKRRLENEITTGVNAWIWSKKKNLIKPFNKGDVNKALFSIHSTKSPGLDGFGYGFYKDLWDKIGNDVSKAVLDFFVNGKLPNSLNETVFSLIPKIENPSSTKDYRSIAYCNTVYKCILKMMYSRLSEVLPSIVSDNKDKKGYGFHPLCKHLRSTNLCFADDLVIFCKGNYNSVRLTFEAFHKFCDATGLSANTSKCHIYFGGVSEEVKSKILDLVQIEEGSFPLKYLGVNLRPTKWKVTDCGIILDKVNKNLNYWASINLSFPGHAQLIHSVLLRIRNFWMSIFIIPSKITAAIDKSCRDYLWGITGIGDCLWVKRINSGYLKEYDIWSYPQKMDDSWYFKKILSLRETMDEARMCLAVKGNKLRAKMYYDLLVEVDKVDYARAVWDKRIVPKHRFLSSQIANTQLLPRDFLSQIMTISRTLCPVCEVEFETHDHLFFTCSFAKQVVAFVVGLLVVVAAA
uniref:Reverse transcriptase zinc-binding domain-containing protein n=1 Tax=Cannabis sativa TaxID=3483 RepID=A0A803QRF1_CANSA